MSQSGDNLIFDGANGLTSGAFVRAVRQEALQKDRHKDDEWIAHLAASYLDGEALEWYEDLSSDTQDDWKLLRRAILLRWPANQPAGRPSSSIASHIIPASVPSTIAPAPAAAPTSAAPGATPSLSASNSSIIARIRIVCEGREFGWLSRFPDNEGDLGGTQDISKALIVQITSENKPHRIKLLSHPFNDQSLGMIWNGERDLLPDLQTGTLRGGSLIPVRFSRSAGSSPQLLPPTDVHKGLIGVDVWNILLDGSLILTWEGSYSARYHLGYEIIVTPGPCFGQIFVVNEYGRVPDRIPFYQSHRFQVARLIFEPV